MPVMSTSLKEPGVNGVALIQVLVVVRIPGQAAGHTLDRAGPATLVLEVGAMIDGTAPLHTASSSCYGS
jgi:hypothetical protein